MFTKVIIYCTVVLYASANYHEKFQRHLEKHGKKYDHMPEEVRLRRQANYLKNLELIERHNNDPKNNFKLGSNPYTDRDNQRFVEDMGRAEMHATPRAMPRPPSIFPPTTSARAAVDYRSMCQPIGNIGGCGSDWAFATVALIELYNAIRGRPMISLSPQNLIDCDTDDNGCSGGWPIRALYFLKNKYGNKLARDCDYPYISGTSHARGPCKTVPSYVPLYFSTYFQANLNGNETLLKQIVSNYGPVIVCIYMSPSGLFQNYKSGIFYDSTCPVSTPTFNQFVLLVGYGTDAVTNQDYWIIRNAWSTRWGEAGYMRIARNRNNNCNTACMCIGIE